MAFNPSRKEGRIRAVRFPQHPQLGGGEDGEWGQKALDFSFSSFSPRIVQAGNHKGGSETP